MIQNPNIIRKQLHIHRISYSSIIKIKNNNFKYKLKIQAIFKSL